VLPAKAPYGCRHIVLANTVSIRRSRFEIKRRIEMSFIAGVVLFVVVVGLVDRRLPWPPAKHQEAGKW
jgi:hypothetical protein